MGPLVPEIISNEMNLIVALIVGVGFGFFLEQAGFSSTKKLVGMFYGNDFTVIRVFFTAGVVALIGVLLLTHFGLLDIEAIYINPTFLRSAIVGGAIMGAGFIIGGFCPGTSICAATIGKIDGMAFVVGTALGILVFAEGYPMFEELYKMDNMGALRMDQYFSMSPELFAFVLAAIAIGTFLIVTKIENRVNGIKSNFSKKNIIKYSISAIIPVVLLFIIGVTPNKEQYILNKVAESIARADYNYKVIESDDLAGRLVRDYSKLNLIDIRSKEEYKKYHLPLAISIPLESLRNSEYRTILTQTHKMNVFYGADKRTVKQAFILAKYTGGSENFILGDTISNFKKKFFTVSAPSQTTDKHQKETYKFRVKTAKKLLYLDELFKKFNQPVKKVKRKISGGCS